MTEQNTNTFGDAGKDHFTDAAELGERAPSDSAKVSDFTIKAPAATSTFAMVPE